jgi:2-polyprenyl-3-methyl-5-hydroxy-6-metoxy-1,4-benzoquinol methylase
MFEISDLNSGATQERGVLLKCEVCGCLYPDRFPTPETLGVAYKNYYTEGVIKTRRSGWLHRVMAVSRRGYLSRNVSAQAVRVLDFGCGDGAFLSALKLHRPDLELFGSDIARAPQGMIDFQWLSPDRLEDAGPFDWITLGHVIEHHPSASALVGRLASVLAPGGGLWIATPNAESFLIAMAGAGARDIDFPRHKEILTRRALSHLLVKSGLEVQFLSAPLLNAALNTRATIANLARDRASRPMVRAWAIAKSLAGLAGHMIAPKPLREERSPEIVAIGWNVRQPTLRDSVVSSPDFVANSPAPRRSGRRLGDP